MDAITFLDFSFWYPKEEKAALSHIQWKVKEGAFIVLCGKTGSGKTTFLKQMKREIAPVGRTQGSIVIFGKEKQDNPKDSAAQVGFVMQNPENQLVMDTVWHELAFGLENLGMPGEAIRRRVAETAHFFGIGPWFEKKVCELSGGQKQMLNLAAVVAMQPKVLVLDEPTAQLDPIAAKEFLQMLGRLNRELGTTVILSEHRLDDVAALADQIVFLECGEIKWEGNPRGFAQYVYEEELDFAKVLPIATQFARHLGAKTQYPANIREGRAWVIKEKERIRPAAQPEREETTEAVLRAKDIWFRYDRQSDFVLQGVETTLYSGKIHALVGGNGSGKSTLLQVLSGVYPPTKGKVKKEGEKRIAVLAQNPKALFLRDTIEEDCMEWAQRFSYTREDVNNIMEEMGLSYAAKRHPYDLSGGEMQKAALAKILLLKPDILLLDEPAKGLDARAKEEFTQRMFQLKNQGKAIFLVTHDLELAAQTADICSMMFRGEITCTDQGKRFFMDNVFYTTGVNRMTRGILEGCVVIGDVEHVE